MNPQGTLQNWKGFSYCQRCYDMTTTRDGLRDLLPDLWKDEDCFKHGTWIEIQGAARLGCLLCRWFVDDLPSTEDLQPDDRLRVCFLGSARYRPISLTDLLGNEIQTYLRAYFEPELPYPRFSTYSEDGKFHG